MPEWVDAGYGEFAKRLPRECELKLREIVPGQRGKNADLVRAVEEEGQRMLEAIPTSHHAVALDLSGEEWSTPQLSQVLERWLREGQHVSLMIGGPEGLSPACLNRAQQRWRLSALTLPHPLVRVVVAEQLYRAWSILHHHPYHR